MKQSDKLKELLEEIRKLAEKTVLYLPVIESLDQEKEPEEPLIKDERIRKAVRAWAEANCIEGNDRVLMRRWDNFDFVEIERDYKMSIRFYLTTIDRISELENRTYYTITELCGEEE